ncbi:hypothetical protein [Timonella senegalensis]|uniref:hypothetical protein n=1 Tax=Timonella senegalensis TaxID=1465825 RepID=UPI0028A7E904|nr:hypothetical protein [Timonella senegalensis]
MSKLEPQVGDRVTVTHDPTGNTLTGEVSNFRSGEIRGLVALREFDFWHFSERGWSVTEVHECPKPEPGTFVKGVDKGGDAFRGVVFSDGIDGVVWGHEMWHPNVYSWEEISTWEVIS